MASARKAGRQGGKRPAESTALAKRSEVSAKDLKRSDDSVPVSLVGGGLEKTLSIIKENLGSAGQLTISDLTRVTIPPGGGSVWQMPSPAGGKSVNKETLDCVIIASTLNKAYWKESFDQSGGGTPPDCRSVDMVHGIGDPGIECANCPNNQFGSARGKKAEGKACKDLRFLFFLEGTSRLPKLLIVPPTSLLAMRRYFLDIASNEQPYWSVVTSLALIEDKNKAGIKYSKLKPSVLHELDDRELEMSTRFHEMMMPLIDSLAAQITATHVND